MKKLKQIAEYQTLPLDMIDASQIDPNLTVYLDNLKMYRTVRNADKVISGTQALARILGDDCVLIYSRDGLSAVERFHPVNNWNGVGRVDDEITTHGNKFQGFLTDMHFEDFERGLIERGLFNGTGKSDFELVEHVYMHNNLNDTPRLTTTGPTIRHADVMKLCQIMKGFDKNLIFPLIPPITYNPR